MSIQRGLVAAVVISLVVLTGPGCSRPTGPREAERPDYGTLASVKSPPSALDPYFEAKPGQVWVHGRWARLHKQWVWQPGYHVPERPGQVYVNGYWDRKDGAYQWVMGEWKPVRPGFVYIAGHWELRGSAYVWMRGRWERERPGHRYVPGHWVEEGGERRWEDGAWESQTAHR